MPKIKVISKKLGEIKDNCIVIAFFEDKLKLSNEIAEFDKTLGNIIANSIKNKDFKAEEGEKKLFYINANIKYLALLGLGKEEKFSQNKLMDNMASLSKKLRSSDIKSFTLYLDSFKNKSYDNAVYLEKIVQSIILSLYQSNQFKTKDLDKIKSIGTAAIIV